jgi:NAD(P)-dependent dehydrogenase (short-subunit alcohol dehydrogenase family)
LHAHWRGVAHNSPCSISNLNPVTPCWLGWGNARSKHSLVECDVPCRDRIGHAAAELNRRLGKLDCLIKEAAGNKPQGKTSCEATFCELPAEALRWVTDLNILGTILPCQILERLAAI